MRTKSRQKDRAEKVVRDIRRATRKGFRSRKDPYWPRWPSWQSKYYWTVL